MTLMRGWDELISPALMMFLIEGGEYPILVDTGPRDPEHAMRYHVYKLAQDASEVPVEALRRCGYEPDDIKLVISTHLHWDHCCNNDKFPNAKFLVQRVELQFALEPLEWSRIGYEKIPGLEPPWYSVWHQIETVEGDVEVAPGISTVFLPGHTPGLQGVLVEGESNRFLIASDCVPLYESWAGDETATHIPDGLYTDLVAYAESFKKIERLERLGYEVIPGHDPLVMDRGVFA